MKTKKNFMFPTVDIYKLEAQDILTFSEGPDHEWDDEEYENDALNNY